MLYVSNIPRICCLGEFARYKCLCCCCCCLVVLFMCHFYSIYYCTCERNKWIWYLNAGACTKYSLSRGFFSAAWKKHNYIILFLTLSILFMSGWFLLPFRNASCLFSIFFSACELVFHIFCGSGKVIEKKPVTNFCYLFIIYARYWILCFGCWIVGLAHTVDIKLQWFSVWSWPLKNATYDTVYEKLLLYIITVAKERYVLPGACLFVCEQFHVETTDRNFVKCFFYQRC